MRPRLRILLLLWLAVCVGGCWDVIEIDDRAIAVGIGLDAAGDGRVMLSLQLPLLQEQGTATGSPSGGSSPQTYVISAEAETAYACIPLLEGKTSMRMFTGQLKSIVISAELARRGLHPYIEFLEQHPKIPPQAVVALTEGRALDILSANPQTTMLPAISLVSYFETGMRDMVFPVRKWQLMHLAQTTTEDPETLYLPLIEFDRDERVFVLRGLGVFNHDRLAGTLDGTQSRMFGLMAALSNSAWLPVDLGGDLGQITYRLVKSKHEIKAEEKNGSIEFTLEVRANGFLSEMTRLVTPVDAERQHLMEEKTRDYLEREMAGTITHLQELNSDILGLGEFLRAKRPDIWRRIDWQNEFPRVHVKVEVDFTMGRMGTYR